MNQLRRCARRAAAEVAGIHERHGEPGARRMGRRRRTDDAPTDDEEVELARGEPIESLPARSCTYTERGFAHAFFPTASVTSTRTWRAAGGISSRARTTRPSSSVASTRPR